MGQRPRLRVRGAQPPLSKGPLRRAWLDHLHTTWRGADRDACRRSVGPARGNTARRGGRKRGGGLLGGPGEVELSELELEEASGVLAQDLDLSLRLQRQGIELLDDARRLEERIIAAEQ